VQQDQKGFNAMQYWLTTPSGKSVALSISEKVNNVLSKIQGIDSLTIGIPPQCFNADFSRFNYNHYLSESIDPTKTNVVADYSKLPFKNGSIDCVFAPFTLELVENRTDTLEEIDRILSPMSYVILVGVNPISLWGLPWIFSKNTIPIKSRCYTAYGLRKQLARYGYLCLHISSFYYIPPVSTDKMIKKLTFLDEVGKMIWPFPAGFYLLLAQKMESNIIQPLAVKERSGLVFNQNVI
jgi:hypothetical protein